MKTWYQKARELMKERGIKVREIAEALDMTPGGAGHYLSGRREPGPGVLIKIAKRIGVSVAELVEEDPKFARDEIELDMLDALRQMSIERKEAALAAARGMIDGPPEIPLIEGKFISKTPLYLVKADSINPDLAR